MCEKMSKSPVRYNLGFFLRKTCLYITDIGKGIIPALAKKGFYPISIKMLMTTVIKRQLNRTKK